MSKYYVKKNLLFSIVELVRNRIISAINSKIFDSQSLIG